MYVCICKYHHYRVFWKEWIHSEKTRSSYLPNPLLPFRLTPTSQEWILLHRAVRPIVKDWEKGGDKRYWEMYEGVKKKKKKEKKIIKIWCSIQLTVSSSRIEESSNLTSTIGSFSSFAMTLASSWSSMKISDVCTTLESPSTTILLTNSTYDLQSDDALDTRSTLLVSLTCCVCVRERERERDREREWNVFVNVISWKNATKFKYLDDERWVNTELVVS